MLHLLGSFVGEKKKNFTMSEILVIRSKPYNTGASPGVQSQVPALPAKNVLSVVYASSEDGSANV